MNRNIKTITGIPVGVKQYSISRTEGIEAIVEGINCHTVKK